MSKNTVWARQYLDEITERAETIQKVKTPDQILALTSLVQLGMLRVIALMLIEIAEHMEEKE